MTRDPLRDALEVYRPGTADMDMPEMEAVRRQIERDPEFAETARRVAEWDRRLGAAIRQVSAPAGLRSNILAKLAQPQVASAVPQADADSAELDLADAGMAELDELLSAGGLEAPRDLPSVRTDRPGGSIGKRWWRDRLQRSRRWMIPLASVVAALFVIVMASHWWTAPETLRPDQLAEHLARLSDSLQRAPYADLWQPSASAPGAEYPLPTWLTGRPVRWQRIATEVDPQAVVYQLSVAPTRDVYCFVMRPERRIEGLAESPPSSPHRSTGGWNVGAWYSSPHLYTLAVEGDMEQYRSLVEPRGHWVVLWPRPLRPVNQL